MKRRTGRRMEGGWLALLGGLTGCAVPVVPPPVCGQLDVLQRVEDTLRVQGQPVVLDAPPVGEVSTAAVPVAGPPVAQCAVRAHRIGYDTNRFGTAPVYEPFIVRYTTELRHNGMFVHVE